MKKLILLSPLIAFFKQRLKLIKTLVKFSLIAFFKQRLKLIKTLVKLSLAIFFSLNLVGCNKGKPIPIKKLTAEEIKKTPLTETATEQTAEQATEKEVEKTKDIVEETETTKDMADRKETTQKPEAPVSSQKKAIVSDNQELAGNTKVEETGEEKLTMKSNTWPVVPPAPEEETKLALNFPHSSPTASSSPVTRESSIVSLATESPLHSNIKKGVLPLATEIKYDQAFNTFKNVSQKPCEKSFCLFAVPAVSPDPFSKKLEYFVWVKIKSRKNLVLASTDSFSLQLDVLNKEFVLKKIYYPFSQSPLLFTQRSTLEAQNRNNNLNKLTQFNSSFLAPSEPILLLHFTKNTNLNQEEDEASTDRASTDRASTDTASTDRASTDRASTDTTSTDRVSTDRASTDTASTDTAFTEGVKLILTYQNRENKEEVVILFINQWELKENDLFKKDIALVRYLNLMKNWVQYERRILYADKNNLNTNLFNMAVYYEQGIPAPPDLNNFSLQQASDSQLLTVSQEYKKLFKEFSSYFEQAISEKQEILIKEIATLNTLIAWGF